LRLPGRFRRAGVHEDQAAAKGGPGAGRRRGRGGSRRRARAGAATLDYVLVMGVVLPLAAIVLWYGPRLMARVYEMTCVLVSWPFL
jgi:hypothetical protein